MDGSYQPKRTDEGPQLLLQSAEAGREYKPQQFTNSLGMRQAVNVKAPRKIIDVGTIINETTDGQSTETKNSR